MKFSRNKIIFMIILIFLIFSCSEKKSGIDGNNNTNNQVIIGDNNIIKKDRPATKENIFVSISTSNDLVDLFYKEEYEEHVSYYGKKRAESWINGYGRVKYNTEIKNNELSIYPSNQYLEEFNNEDEIISQGPEFIMEYPNLDFKITNNSDESIFIENIILEVKSSKIDKTPLLIFSEQLHELNIHNDSWGEVFDVKVSYNIYPNGINKNQLNFGNFEFSQSQPEFQDCENPTFCISIENDLLSLGMNLDLIRNLNVKPFINDMPNPIFFNSFGKFKPKEFIIDKRWEEYFVDVAGILSYTYFDESGKKKSKSHKFLQMVGVRHEGRGAASGPSFQYSAMLKEEGENYKVSVPVSQTLKAKEMDRFNLFIGTKKSSFHKLKVTTKYNKNSTIESEDINLHIFCPPSYLEYRLENGGDIKSNRVSPQSFDGYLYSWVEGLRVREKPFLNSEVKSKLKENDKLIFLGNKSDLKSTVKLRNAMYTDYFYLVKTKNNIEGWVHGSGLKKMKKKN